MPLVFGSSSVRKEDTAPPILNRGTARIRKAMNSITPVKKRYEYNYKQEMSSVLYAAMLVHCLTHTVLNWASERSPIANLTLDLGD
jgi:hypothetical protein